MTVTEALNLIEGDQVRSIAMGRLYTVKGIVLDAGQGRQRHIWLAVLTETEALRTLSHEWLDVVKSKNHSVTRD